MKTHKSAHNNLSAEFVRSILRYDQNTGIIRWKITLSNRNPVGSIAGYKADQGRIKIGIRGREYTAHRLAWIYVTGNWPCAEIDHINRNPSDNRWKNLREATSSENQFNRGIQKNNTSGYKGVTYVPGRKKWMAQIMVNYRHYGLGYFSSPKLASAAYKKAAAKHRIEFATH